MATERLSMRKTREILRLKWALGRSHREITRALGVGLSTISETASRATLVGLDWSGVDALGDDELEARLYPPPSTEMPRPLPDPAALDLELRRVGVTLRLLHHEYLEANPGGYGYTQFCEVYRQWRKRPKLSMRQEHKAGDKLFVDYSGKKPSIVDPTSGERVEVELFVAVLGASNYSYAEATRTQQVPDWLGSHARAFEFLDGVTAAVVPDQLKSGVTRADRYEPGLHRSYEEMGRHYGTAIIPARPAHPRDKAKVEVGVQIAQRWILARLRNQIFFSLDELNARIRELLTDLDTRVMRRYGVSRRELFERLDRPALRARRICDLAELPAITSHSLRGLHSTLATETGSTGHAVAAALGHTSYATTKAHYLKPGTVERMARERVQSLMEDNGPTEPPSA